MIAPRVLVSSYSLRFLSAFRPSADDVTQYLCDLVLTEGSGAVPGDGVLCTGGGGRDETDLT